MRQNAVFCGNGLRRVLASKTNKETKQTNKKKEKDISISAILWQKGMS